MTTIAYKDGILACDSAWTDDRECVGTLLTKLFVLPGGAVVGEAGDNDSRCVRELLKNVKCIEKLPTAKDLAECKIDYVSIIVFPDGRFAKIMIDHDDKKGWIAQAWECNRGFIACGSGGEMALGFMGAGKTAAEAVAFTCTWDPNSKLPVHTVDINEIKKKKRR